MGKEKAKAGDVFDGINVLPVDRELLAVGFPDVFASQTKETIKDGEAWYTYKVKHKCGHVEEITFHWDFDDCSGMGFACRKCGCVSSFMEICAERKETNKVVCFLQPAHDGGVLFRLFHVVEKFEGESDIFEIFRAVAGEKEVLYYKPEENEGECIKWKRLNKSTVYKYLDEFHDKTINGNFFCMAQTPEEIAEIFEGSRLRDSGIPEILGAIPNHARKKIGRHLIFGKDLYLETWYQNPAIAKILKAGFARITCEVITQGVEIGHEGDAFDILGTTAEVGMVAAKHDCDIAKLKLMDKVFKGEEDMASSEFGYMNSFTRFRSFLDVKEEYQIPCRKQVEYLKKCEKEQCIQWNEAMIIWMDCLWMAKQMASTLDDSIKFPKSLKLLQDTLKKCYSELKEKKEHNAFVEKATKYMGYGYEGDYYTIKMPVEPQDIMDNAPADEQAGLHIEHIMHMGLAVAFLRDKEFPDTPLYTIEIMNGEIRQVRGRDGMLPYGENTIAFIYEWAKEKGLKIKTYDLEAIHVPISNN